MTEYCMAMANQSFYIGNKAIVHHPFSPKNSAFVAIQWLTHWINILSLQNMPQVTLFAERLTKLIPKFGMVWRPQWQRTRGSVTSPTKSPNFPTNIKFYINIWVTSQDTVLWHSKRIYEVDHKKYLFKLILIRNNICVQFWELPKCEIIIASYVLHTRAG